MRWRDIRFEKPTVADTDDNGEVLQLLKSGRVCYSDWDDEYLVIAWMPISELPAFDRIPDPPEGWRFVVAGDAFDARAMYWNDRKKEWEPTGNRQNYGSLELYTYIVPIDPPAPPDGYELATGDGPHDGLIFYCPIDKQWKPVLRVDGVRKIDPGWYAVPVKPQYRPFANAAEFDIWAFKFWRYKDDLRSVRRPPMSYSDDGHYGDKWDVSFIRKEFADGSPFGVKVG